MALAVVRAGRVEKVIEGDWDISGPIATRTAHYEVYKKDSGDAPELVQTEVRFAAPDGASLIAAPAEAMPGWVYDGETFSIVIPPPTQEELIEIARTLRWSRETTSILVGGIPIATDDRSKLLIMGARMRADKALAAGGDISEHWASPNGVIELHAADIVLISDTLALHVSTCFSVYSAILTEIESGAITTRAQIEDAIRAIPTSYAI